MNDNDPTLDAVEPRRTMTFDGDVSTRTQDAVGGSTPMDSAIVNVPGYVLGDVLGEGGMGRVYRATDAMFERDIAIKVLHPRYRPDSPAVGRFLKEARITAQLQHPSIPPVHQVGVLPNGMPFLAMKLIRGETLAKKLKTKTGQGPEWTTIFLQVCQGMAYAHDKSVIHRDLKPDNVMVGAFGEVQIMDWGLAKILTMADTTDGSVDPDDAGLDGQTLAGSVMGTPAYMAPEQARGEIENVDLRSDVFGLGAILCAILTNRPPFTGGDVLSVRKRAIIGDTSDAFSALDQCGADRELIELCKRCLATNAIERPAHAGELAILVADHLKSLDERTKQAELNRVREVEEQKQKRLQRNMKYAAFAIGFLLAIGGFLWKQSNDRKTLNNELQSTNTALSEQKTIAESAQKQLEIEQVKLEQLNDSRVMQVAYQEWLDNHVGTARKMIDGVSDKHRHWEWRLLDSLCRSPSRVYQIGSMMITSLDVSHDGSLLATGSFDRHIRCIDTKTGKERVKLQGSPFTFFPTAVVIDPHGEWIAAGGQGAFVMVWDTKTGKRIRTLEGHENFVNTIAVSRDGSRIVTGSIDKTLRVWDSRTGEEIDRVEKLDFRAFKVTTDQTGQRVAYTTNGKNLFVWDVGSKKSPRKIDLLNPHYLMTSDIKMNAKGDRVIADGGMYDLRMWDLETGRTTVSFRGHSEIVTTMEWFDNDRKIVSGSNDTSIRVWDAETGMELKRYRGHTLPVQKVTASRNGESLVSTAGEGELRLWSTESNLDAIRETESIGANLCLRPTHDEYVLIARNGYESREVEVIRRKGLQTIATLKRPPSISANVNMGAVDPHGKIAAVYDLMGNMTVWSVETNKVISQWSIGPTTRGNLLLTDDAKYLLTVGMNFKTISVWDPQTGRLVRTLTEHKDTVHIVSIHGGTLFSVDRSGIIKTWDIATGVCQSTLTSNLKNLFSMTYLKSQDLLAVASNVGEIEIWDMKTGQKKNAFKDESSGPITLAFHPSGQRLATLKNFSAKIWDITSGIEMLHMRFQKNMNHALFFDETGESLHATFVDGSTITWDATKK